MRVDELVAFVSRTSIRAGDTVLLHSSLRPLGAAGKDAEAIIDAFLSVLGPTGTLAVPTHTWATVNDQQPVFHETYSPSTVGVLTNVFRKRAGAIRSLHATHSVAAIGARAGELVEGHERDGTPCGPTSPYGRLISWGGKVALLGVDLRRCTFFHCVEEIAGHDEGFLVREPKPRVLIRADGSVVHTTARAHAGNTSELFGRVELALLEAEAMEIHPFGDDRVMVVDARRASELLIPMLRENPKLFH